MSTENENANIENDDKNIKAASDDQKQPEQGGDKEPAKRGRPRKAAGKPDGAEESQDEGPLTDTDEIVEAIKSSPFGTLTYGRKVFCAKTKELIGIYPEKAA